MRALGAAAALLLIAHVASAALPLTPSSIAADVREHGAKATVDALLKAREWDGVADKMGGGDSRWIALAPMLAPGSDAGSAEDLGISLAFSLPLNAPAVLAALDPANGPIVGAQRVCEMPFIEDTVTDLAGYKRQAIRAVEAVRGASLVPRRNACLAVLRAQKV